MKKQKAQEINILKKYDIMTFRLTPEKKGFSREMNPKS